MEKGLYNDKEQFIMLLALERNLLCCTFAVLAAIGLSKVDQAIQPFGLTFTLSEATTSAIAKDNEEHNQALHK